MGRTQQTPRQEDNAEQGRFETVGAAYDLIAPFAEQQFDYRQSGITYVCNELGNVDAPGMGSQLLKSGLKIGLGAAAGAVGAFTGGLGWVALGAIGLGFGVGGEVVDAVFAGPSAPGGIEGYRMGRENVLNRMKAVETSALRTRLGQATVEQREEAYNSYERVATSQELQQAEIRSTLDGWMNALNAKVNGTGGAIGEGSAGSTDATTGRLFMRGRAYRRNGAFQVGVSSATIDSLDNAELRNSYLNRSISGIGMFVDFALYCNGEWGAITFQAGNSQLAVEGGDRFKAGLGNLAPSHDGPGFWSADHSCADHWNEGAIRILQLLNSTTLRGLGVSSIDAGNSVFN